ncbi:isoleucine--tRNA ligase [Sphingomonas sp. HITSZ_GF]|uniref:isoleucine--tRNA ligase n=1 Tax=Sphingomonas sp. HITSZ_GF TaxID=3037247 RepID=UPI00240DB1F4|nr:isoleucine--tRNA ligase [Sphingomonas sp. HITSZ_GF]MDG2533309.1 isoleucine--tRNA ligase [Sphingomonas sp. HITSZ_GF]
MSDEKDYRDTVFLPKTEFPMKAGLAQKEPAILARWAQIGLYDKLRAQRAGRTRFILHDGPPYANGDIHMGHAMNKVLKDIIVRSQSLMGKDAPYIPGWDCHGLPIEWKVEEAYRAKKLNKDEVDPVAFRAECRAYAEKWVGVQREQFERLGVMGDWTNPYLTMNYESEAIIAGELLKFAESGQLYRGAKPVMWSPVEKTALAEAEVEYEDITSTQIDVAFEIVEAPNAPELVGAHAVIWTTTPWTIPVNQALAYGPEVEYTACVVYFEVNEGDRAAALAALNAHFGLGKAVDDSRFLIAHDLIEAFERRVSSEANRLDLSTFGVTNVVTHVSALSESASRISGEKLAGAIARHPMHKLGGFFAKPRPLLAGDFVTTDAGTGLVHMAPDHGEDDFLLCKANGIDPVFAVDAAGMYRADWLWLGGQGSVINKKFTASDGPICTDLREAGALLAASDDFTHSYPHSWRSKAKVIFRCTPQWFIPMDRPQAVIPAQAGISGEGAGQEPHEIPASAGMTANGNGATLRGIALDAIENTRWVPEKAQNRIRAMVEGRPDWVISRQRAWGVPIALYVHRQTGEYLRDPEVNARILEAFTTGGADAWFQADHQQLLGEKYDLAHYEVITDILDVWFDSGSTHSFVIEARYGVGTRADLYLEGSDQHRGWFQSSLLESSGTRGRAPYDAVLTHGFALDGNGRKMSKSLGNVVDPLKIIGESGADILRLWVAQTDYFEDVRIGKEVLAGTGDAYRKIRNTFRYLLGALDGFSEAERLPVAEMPELERYILAKLAELDAELRSATDGFEFNRYSRALTDFMNEDLSAFFFDIRKDCLYCEAETSTKRRAYRTVLDVLFHALVRYAAPVLAFTAEEVWQARYPSEDESVHMLEWPVLPEGATTQSDWIAIRALRQQVTEAIEPYRREKQVRSSLEAEVTVPDLPASAEDLTELFIVSQVTKGETVTVVPTQRHKCGRCWRHLPEVAQDGALCDRCAGVVE